MKQGHSSGGCGQARGVDVHVAVHSLLARGLQAHLGHRLLRGRGRGRGSGSGSDQGWESATDRCTGRLLGSSVLATKPVLLTLTLTLSLSLTLTLTLHYNFCAPPSLKCILLLPIHRARPPLPNKKLMLMAESPDAVHWSPASVPGMMSRLNHTVISSDMYTRIIYNIFICIIHTHTHTHTHCLSPDYP